ncbi:MAG: 50S ribosomal protein L4 [Acidobacteria bacterium]|nr:50S ribosomal protein L4 [Acidobacteriota bacterium]
MTEIDVRTQSGDVVGRVALDPRVFEAQVNVPVMHQVVRAQLAAARAGTHSVKTRGDVSGGGVKPWRQKGSGRARQGSSRAPHWSGGGVAWGPHPRDHSLKTPKKMKAAALRSALSDRAREGRLAVVERFEFDRPSTKAASGALEALGTGGWVLLVLEGRDETVGKSFRNIGRTHIITVDQLNTYDVLASDWVVFTKAALERVGGAGEAKA